VDGSPISTPIDLGAQTADADGKVTFRWTVGDVAAGQHRVVLDGETSGEASATCPTPAKGTSGGGLATTGGELGLLGPVGLLTLLGGLVLLVATRRRAAAHTE
jgi:hypothetical protein